MRSRNIATIFTTFFLTASIACAAETKGSVKFSVSTTTHGGQFKPRHVLVIWVADSHNKHVKTIKVAGKHHLQYLKNWQTSKKKVKEQLNAVTSATPKKHTTHKVTWNCTDIDGKTMKDGKYTIRVEFTERNGKGPSTSATHIEFRKGTGPVTDKPEDLKNFKNMSLSYTPAP